MDTASCPLASSPYRYVFWTGCCAFYIYLALSLTGAGTRMFADTDPLWHIAAGDWIREHHALPEHDPWSYTAGDYRWLNISWAWDAAFSYAREQCGWHGPVALNAMTIALALTLAYAACRRRSGSAPASLAAVIGAVTLLPLHLRPLQVTNLMTAGWMLLLGMIVRGECRPGWLILLPLSMVLWVNAHGGFLVGAIMLAAFFLEALCRRQHDLARALFLAGLATLTAILCNPYGIRIVEAAWRPLTTVANRFIIEWQPFTASPSNLLAHGYALAFLLLAPRVPLPLLAAERWLAYLWLLLGLTSGRHMYIFAILSTPAMACALQRLAVRLPLPAFATMREALLRCYGRRRIAPAALLSAIGVSLWLPGGMAARLYGQEQVPIANLDAEIDFLDRHYPHLRLLNHFDLGGFLVYQTRGRIPVFIDPRTETAYPARIFGDYLRFIKAGPGWEEMLDRYGIGGAILPNEGDDELLDRFRRRQGWKQVFQGPRATIFIRESRYVDVNEEGTEVAGATAVVMDVAATVVRHQPLPPIFRADHPFVFLIRDNRSGSILFLGRVTWHLPPAS